MQRQRLGVQGSEGRQAKALAVQFGRQAACAQAARHTHQFCAMLQATGRVLRAPPTRASPWTSAAPLASTAVARRQTTSGEEGCGRL